MCVLDVLSMRVKTGISHWRLRPTLAVIDPLRVADHPAGGHRLGRDGHRLPRPGVLHRPLVHHVRAQAARAAGQLPRVQPGLRPVVREGPHAAGPLVPHGVPARVGPRGAEQHDAGGDLRRHGVRQLGRAHPARQRLPDRRHGEGLQAPGLPAGRADGAARNVGVADRPGGVPVHLPQRAGASSGPPPRCWRRRRTS